MYLCLLVDDGGISERIFQASVCVCVCVEGIVSNDTSLVAYLHR